MIPDELPRRSGGREGKLLPSSHWPIALRYPYHALPKSPFPRPIYRALCVCVSPDGCSVGNIRLIGNALRFGLHAQLCALHLVHMHRPV